MPISEDLLKNISDWFVDKILEEKNDFTSDIDIQSKAKVGATIPFFAELFSSITANIKAASSRRETVRKNLKREISVLPMVKTND